MEKNILFNFDSNSIVSPFLFGSNLEHTRNCVHKGISAEMLENRKFVGKPGPNNGCAAHWKPVGQKVYCMLEAPYTRHAEDYHMKRDLENVTHNVSLHLRMARNVVSASWD